MSFKRWQGPIRPVSNGHTVNRLALAADLDAPAAARRAIDALGPQVSEDVLERAMLLTSEVVTNSLRHSGSDQIRVEVWPVEGSVAVIVSDDGGGFVPVARRGTIADSEGGFGLPLLDTLSEAWGSGADDTSWVWFEVSPRIIERASPDLLSVREAQADQLLDIRMVVDSIKDHALVALDPEGRVTNWGTVAQELTGHPSEEILGTMLSDIYHPADGAQYQREIDEAVSEGWRQAERWIRRRNGDQLWVEVVLAPIIGRGGALRGLSALISDATARRRGESDREALIADLRDMAMTDDLTGLPNRRRFSLELNRDLARARRFEKPVVVAMLDLDGFKAFNDSNGHPAGDSLLREVGMKWAEAVRASDLLARYGGDEFAITLPECGEEEAMAVLARVAGATPDAIRCSAGLASSDGSETADALLGRADQALYEAKRVGHAVMASTA